MQVSANDLQIEVEDSGPAHAPAVLLIMGLGMQLTAWPEAWVAALRQAGYRVIDRVPSSAERRDAARVRRVAAPRSLTVEGPHIARMSGPST